MAPVSSNLQNSYAPELATSADPEVVPEENFPEAVNAAWFAASKQLPFDHTVEPQRPTSIRNKKILSFVLLAIVVLGVALGAGLGVGLKDSHSAISASSLSSSVSIAVSSGTSTSSAMQSAVTSGTSTSSATQSAVTSGETAIATIPCTDNGVLYNYTSTRNQFKTVFTEQCTIDWPRGSELLTGSGTVKDLSQVIAYTFASCMDECALFNADTGANNELCTAVVYNWTLTSSDADQGGNCFLKNGRGEDHYDPTVAGAYVVSNRSYVVSDSSSS